jgi:hypothetical protein
MRKCSLSTTRSAVLADWGGWKSRTPILVINDVGLLPQGWWPYAARIKDWNGTLSAGTSEIRNRFGCRLVQELVAAIPNGISVPTGPLANGVTAFLELALAALVFCMISDLNGGGHESGLSSLEAAYGGPRLAGLAGAGCSLAG